MKTVTIYRRDFKNHSDAGKSLFEGLLFDLNISEVLWNDIDEIELDITQFDYERKV